MIMQLLLRMRIRADIIFRSFLSTADFGKCRSSGYGRKGTTTCAKGEPEVVGRGSGSYPVEVHCYAAFLSGRGGLVPRLLPPSAQYFHV